jgi:acetoacetate decarboxylase
MTAMRMHRLNHGRRTVTRVSAPHAPWALVGECVVGVVRRRNLTSSLPAGIHPLPGPCVVSAVRYRDSPVGPYVELAVGEPARLGARPGLCITTMVVTTAEARVGGRLNWGFPKEVGTLRWRNNGDEREVVWEEREIVVRGRPRGPAAPLLMPVRALQRRGDGPVVVPARLRARVHLARVELDVPADDLLAPLAGPHPGVLLSNLGFVVHPARLPRGLTSTLLAPLRAPEPALVSPPGGD